ncbi:MAG: SDR family oxidoreductase [Bacteroidales bacterium]|nr:SDR family oxidoreductase [Bacteroidales bacterium]
MITGASRGIGFELAQKFTIEGHKVIALARSKDKLKKLEQVCREGNRESKLIPVSFDLLSDNLRESFERLVLKHFKKIDILVNNAGMLLNKSFRDFTEEEFDRMYAVNVRAPFFIVQALDELFSEHSHIVNIGSMGGYQGSVKFPGLSLYSSAKGALAVLAECLAEELKDRNIKVNCLALGAAQTEMLEEAFPGYRAPVSAEKMADFIKDFCLTGHHFFNGKILPVSLSTP